MQGLSCRSWLVWRMYIAIGDCIAEGYAAQQPVIVDTDLGTTVAIGFALQSSAPQVLTLFMQTGRNRGYSAVPLLVLVFIAPFQSEYFL